MSTINEQIRDEIAKHQIAIITYAYNLGSKLSTKVNKTNTALYLMLMGEIPQMTTNTKTPLFQEQSKKLYRKIVKVREVGTNPMRKYYLEEMAYFSDMEISYMVDLLTIPLSNECKIFSPPDSTPPSIVHYEDYNGKSIPSWLEKIADDDVARILSTVRIGIKQKLNTSEILRTILSKDVLKTTLAIRTMARTLTNSVGNESRHSVYMVNAHLIYAIQFNSSLDTKKKSECHKLNGVTFASVDATPTPSLHFNCKGFTTPVLKVGGGVPKKTNHAEMVNDIQGGTSQVKGLTTEFSVKNDPRMDLNKLFLK